MHHNTEETLALARAGENEPMGGLLERYASRLFLFVKRETRDLPIDEDQREDILSEVLYQAIASLGRFQYRGDGSFYAWLVRIARNRIIDVARSLRNGPRKPERNTCFRDGHMNLAKKITGVVTRAQRAENTRRIIHALDTLPEEYRTILTLVHLEGCSIGGAARQLEIPASTAYDRMLKAAKAFRMTWERAAGEGARSPTRCAN